MLSCNGWEQPQPHGCPTDPAPQHQAAENKEVLLIQLSTGVLKLHTRFLIALFLWAAFYTHAKQVFSILHLLLTNAEEHIWTTAAWHKSEHIWSPLSLTNIPYDRAGPQGRRVCIQGAGELTAAHGTAPSATSHVCRAQGLIVPRCPALGSQGTPFPLSLLCLSLLFTKHASALRLYLHSPQHYVSL